MQKITDPKIILESYAGYLHDESKYSGSLPECLAFPENLQDLVSIINQANSQNLNICLIGGKTGTTGGCVPTENSVAIAFDRMDRVHNLEKNSHGDLILFCDPGVMLSQLTFLIENVDLFKDSITGIDSINLNSYFYPPDPTEISAQLGGTVATNASGARSYFYGSTRSHIESLSLVFITGDTLTVTRGLYTYQSEEGITVYTDQGNTFVIPGCTYNYPTIKNASGYYRKDTMDLIDLFIGSEGTLAVIARIGIRLQKKPPFISGCTFFSTFEDTLLFANYLRTEKQIAAIEYFDKSALNFMRQNQIFNSMQNIDMEDNFQYALLWEFIDKTPEPFEAKYEYWDKYLRDCGTSMDNTWSGIDKKDSEKLKSIRHALPEVVNSYISSIKAQFPMVRKIGTDTALPAVLFPHIFTKYIKVIECKKFQYVAFGHLGDYHIHINILPSDDQTFTEALNTYDEIIKMTIDNGGTISAEHGIGKIKKKYLPEMYGFEALEQMKSIKRALDPSFRLNAKTLF
jgi:D-lactate dehydrogenase (cytochrome)